jgi:hypothetical protein
MSESPRGAAPAVSTLVRGTRTLSSTKALTMRRLTMVIAGVACVVGPSLVGTGAYAWPKGPAKPPPQPPAANIVLSATGASGSYTRLVTLGAVGPIGSSFTSGLVPVTITNDGNAPASLLTLGVSDRSTNHVFRQETWACVIVGARQLANEPLATVEGYGAARVPGITITPHGTATYAVVFYAGATEATGCGGAMSDLHSSRWGWGRHWNNVDGVAYPSGATNPASTSLTNAAQGGVLELTVTTNYVVRHDDDQRCRRWRDAAQPREEHDCR